jgi:hypothetical protein
MRHGVGSLVGKSEKNLRDSLGFKDLLCLSLEGEERFSQGVVFHFNVCPLDAVSKAPSDGFEKSLLGRKPAGETLGRTSPSLTPKDFFLCKNPAEKEISPTRDQPPDSFDIDDVDTRSNDHNQFKAPSLKLKGFRIQPSAFSLELSY